MHVLQLGPIPPPEGGVTRNMMSIREELHRRNHTCSILATARSSKELQEPGLYYPRGPLELMGLLLRTEYDILHLHVGGEIPPRVLGLVFLCGVVGKRRNLLTLHSGGYVSKVKPGANRWSLTGSAFRLYERIICVNESMIKMFKDYGCDPESLRLIHPFSVEPTTGDLVMPGFLKRFSQSHSPFLLTVGQLEDEYDLGSQIDCMEQVRDVFPNVGLMIIGSGSLESQLRRQIESKDYRDGILLAGDLPHGVTMQLIKDCDVLLRTTRFDGDAISIREALYLGKPVIATDNGMRPEGVSLISNPLQGSEFVGTVLDVVSGDSDLSRPDSPDGRENIEAVIELYEELLAT